MSDSPIDVCLERWHRHIEGDLPGGLDALLHEDCVFYSPIVFTPQRGRDITKLYLMAAEITLVGAEVGPDGSPTSIPDDTPFRYVSQAAQDNHAVLQFETEIDGLYLNGVDMITCDDEGMITEFKVMVRPLQAINAIHTKMKEMIAELAGA